MRKRSKQKYKLKVSSVTENLEIIRDFVNNIATKAGFSDDTADQIELAVDEACTNVVKHAHKYNAKRMIDISVILEPEKIEIIISDTGGGFDVDKLPRPNLEKFIHESKSGGLGIHLMRTLMDEVNFTFNPGKKNQVSLIKYLKKSKI